MDKREKVIRALENCTARDKCLDCPWESCEYDSPTLRIPLDLAQEALELLKQEPVVPIENSGFYYCGKCKYAFTVHRQKYCSNCGKPVKWDG